MKKVVLEQLRETFYEERLPNGLLIRVIPRPDFAKTYSFFATDFGSIDTKFTMDGKVYETPAGVAHYLEHKLFDMPEGNVMQQFSALGGSPNAFTGYSMTAYHVESTENWRENLELLLRYVSTPYFTEESVEKERGIIAQEIRMYEDSSGSRMYENLFAALYQHHPIRVPIAGTVESIQDITAQTLYDCHKAFYDPSNMMLCVAGPVDPALVVESAREILPKTPGGVGGRDYGPAEPLTAEKMARVEQNMEVSMPGFTVAFRCDTPKTGADILRQEIAFVMGNVGKICDNRVKFLFPEWFKQRAAEKPHVRKRKRGQVPFGPAECVYGNLRPPDFKVGTLRGQREGNRAGSRAEFAYACTGRQISDEQFRKQFRFRTGNQRTGPDLQIEKAELRPAENILKRFFSQPARKVSASFFPLLRSQGTVPEKRQFNIWNAGNFRDNIGALQLRRFKVVPAECLLQFPLEKKQVHFRRLPFHAA